MKMLRKLLPGFLALTLLLSACGEAPAATEYDPAKTAQALLDSGAFSEELDALDADLVAGVYGLAAEPASAAVYASTGATAEEVVVLKYEKQEDADAAYKALEKRVADQKEACEGYLPLEIPKLDSSIVKESGLSVLLVVANDYAAAQKALDGLN